MPAAFAPDDARPDLPCGVTVLSGLSRGPCLTHDTEKASPAAAASINPARQALLRFQPRSSSISVPFEALTFASWKHRVKPLISRAGGRACVRAPRKPIHAFIGLIEFPRRPARITSRPRDAWAEACADDASSSQDNRDPWGSINQSIN